MTTDEQVRRLMSLIKKGLPLSTAAVKAGMSEPTARKYRRAGKLPGEMNGAHAGKASCEAAVAVPGVEGAHEIAAEFIGCGVARTVRRVLSHCLWGRGAMVAIRFSSATSSHGGDGGREKETGCRRVELRLLHHASSVSRVKGNSR